MFKWLGIVLALILGAIGLFSAAVYFHEYFESTSGPTSTETTPASDEPPQLTADIGFNGTELLIKNDDQFEWKNCELKANYEVFGSDGYEIEIRAIAPQMTQKIEVIELSTGAGERFNPFTHKLKKLFLRCETPSGHQYTGGSFN